MSDEHTAEVQAAETAAREWLSLLDAADYGECWERASELLRNAVGKEALAESLERALTPFGPLRNRELSESFYETALPGAPDGEYVVLQFSTSFEKKRIAVETITPMLEADGRWRVSGYYIK